MLKPISEIDKNVLKTLYSLRLPGDINVPYERYISRYDMIVVDNDCYCSETCSKERIIKYFGAMSGSYMRATLPCAIITNGNVIKNRYGRHGMLIIDHLNLINTNRPPMPKEKFIEIEAYITALIKKYHIVIKLKP